VLRPRGCLLAESTVSMTMLRLHRCHSPLKSKRDQRAAMSRVVTVLLLLLLLHLLSVGTLLLLLLLLLQRLIQLYPRERGRARVSSCSS